MDRLPHNPIVNAFKILAMVGGVETRITESAEAIKHASILLVNVPNGNQFNWLFRRFEIKNLEIVPEINN